MAEAVHPVSRVTKAMICRLILFSVIGVLTLVSDVSAQRPPGEAVLGSEAIALPEYRLGPGDQLIIRVQGVREFNQTSRISNSGRIRVPYVGIMFAAGKSAQELEREIADRIEEHELVNEPLVRVEVDQQRASPAYIVGEVAAPGQFVITGETYLLDLISRAGGLQPNAGSIGYIYRRPMPRPEVTARLTINAAPEDAAAPAPPQDGSLAATPAEGDVIRINIDDLQDGVRPELNVRVNGGDVVYIPRRPMRNVYIIGDVKVPGVYGLPRRGEVTAVQAIVYAGGPMATAKVKAGFLMRYNDAGVHEAIPINFKRILEGKEPDVPVRPDDIIFIPNSNVKTIGIGLLNMIPNLVIQFLIF